MLFITVISIFGCSKQISDTAYNDLITNLEKKGFNVIAEDVKEDILQGQRKLLTINENENISVYTSWFYIRRPAILYVEPMLYYRLL